MTEWLKYQWTYHEQSAVFRVDMQYWNLLPVLHYTSLLSVRTVPRLHKGDFLSAEQYVFNLFRKRILAKLPGDTIYAGAVNTPNEYYLYFYTSEPARKNDILHTAKSYSALSVSCAVTEEAEYPTYYAFLYPNDAKLQSVDNAAFLASLRIRNDESGLVHRIRLSAAFIEEQDRLNFLAGLSGMGLVPGALFSRPGSSHPFCCFVYGYAPLLLNSLNRLTERVLICIAPKDGIITGLSCEEES